MEKLRIISLVLLVFVAVNALIAGYLFIVDPSGPKLAMSTESSHDSPFRSFLVPGIVLFVINGTLNLLAVSGTLLHWRIYSELITLQGMILIVWIAVQVFVFSDIRVLHYIFAGIGLLLFSIGIRLQQLINHH